VEQGQGRVEADVAAVEYFRRTYDIWKPGGTPPREHPEMTASMRELLRRTRAAQEGQATHGFPRVALR
jgi:hypothetical protein